MHDQMFGPDFDEEVCNRMTDEFLQQTANALMVAMDDKMKDLGLPQSHEAARELADSLFRRLRGLIRERIRKAVC
jgi:hypothetical protein